MMFQIPDVRLLGLEVADMRRLPCDDVNAVGPRVVSLNHFTCCPRSQAGPGLTDDIMVFIV